MADDLGEIERVAVREIWANEATVFTPWLAREENIRRLGLAIGIELQVEGTEVAVGPYSADILARDTGNDRYVVIENQLEKTDHDHLGKVITYSAVLDASAVVWVATEFTEEHRKALDWLNENSTDEVSFFGIVVEALRIDDSKPAVQFKVVSRATDILRRSNVIPKGELSDTKKLQLEFWTRFRDALAASKTVPSVRTPGPRYWYSIALGRTGIHLSNIADTYGNKIGVRVYMRAKYNADAALEQLLSQKTEIEAEIGEKLLWNPTEGTRDKIIALYRPADLTKRNEWDDYCKWLLDATIRFRRCFAPRVRALDLEFEPEDSDDDEEPTATPGA